MPSLAERWLMLTNTQTKNACLVTMDVKFCFSSGFSTRWICFLVNYSINKRILSVVGKGTIYMDATSVKTMQSSGLKSCHTGCESAGSGFFSCFDNHRTLSLSFLRAAPQRTQRLKFMSCLVFLSRCSILYALSQCPSQVIPRRMHRAS